MNLNSGLIFDYPLIPDKIKFNTFYIGSCRYMHLFPKHFPARLHTTKEIINFLNNYNKIDLKMVDANYILVIWYILFVKTIRLLIVII